MSITFFKNKLYRLLKKSEKYTQTDMIYLARGGFWLGLSEFMFFGASFLLSIAFANFLSKETYGTYKFVLSFLTILAIPMMGSMSTALTRAVARGREGAFLPAFKLKLRLGALSSLAALGIAVYYFAKSNLTLTLAFALIACFVPFLNSFNLYTSLLGGRKRFDTLAKYNVFRQTGSLITMVVVMFLTDKVLFVLLSYFLSHTLLNLFFFLITLKRAGPNKKEDAQAIPFGIQLSLLNIIQKIAGEIDKILLWHFLGAAQIALYSFATMPVENIISLINSNISTLAFPKLSARPTKQLKNTLPQKVFRYFLIMLPLALFYILLAPFVFKIFYPQYLEAVRYSQIFALMLVIVPFSQFGSVLLAKMRKKEIAILRIISPIIQIGLLLLFCSLYGMVGVILARLINNVLYFGLTAFFFKRMGDHE